MTETDTLTELLLLLGGLAGILGMFTAIIFWAVKGQVTSLKQDNKSTSDRLQKHIDTKLEGISSRVDAHDKQIHAQHVAQLTLRNEILEDMRDRYVRHDDIVEIKTSIRAIFQRMDKIIFKPGGDSEG